VLASNCREILRCIRCGACLNVCPVYRQVSGHAYRSVYPGPVGAVLSPLLSDHFSERADLPKASSLCGACNEVCPVNIPIPDLLLRLRDRAKVEGIPSPGVPPMGAWAILASSPLVWRAALFGGRMLNVVPRSLIPVPAFQAWQGKKDLPTWRGGQFRKWMKERSRNGGSD
jgi:L-lactate dehydrogenase complex protein LldF